MSAYKGRASKFTALAHSTAACIAQACGPVLRQPSTALTTTLTAPKQVNARKYMSQQLAGTCKPVTSGTAAWSACTTTVSTLLSALLMGLSCGGKLHTEVGSSSSRMDGFISSSCPIDALLRSPPEIPLRKNPPTCHHTCLLLSCRQKLSSRLPPCHT